MTLCIKAQWGDPVELVEVGGRCLYGCPALATLPISAGAYIFGRVWGGKPIPLYVGQAMNIRRRVNQHLTAKTQRLMAGIKESRNGTRFLIYCIVNFRQGQDRDTVLNVLEKSLIEHALGSGFNLLNKQGMALRVHVVNLSGNRTSEAIVPRKIYLEA